MWDGKCGVGNEKRLSGAALSLIASRTSGLNYVAGRWLD